MKISFTSGTIQKLTDEFYTLNLYKGEELVYTATLESIEAAELIDKYNNKKIKLIS